MDSGRSLGRNGAMTRNSLSGGGMTRMADSQVVRVTPKPFSPFYEESNLMLPRDRREVNAWARHYYATDPWVGNAIDLHSTYPLSAFGVKSDDPEVTKFFNAMLDRLNFSSIIYDIGKEFNIIGEVFPYCELNESTGEWSKIIIQNPDYIEVKSNSLTTSMISLMPDDELKRLVTSTNPDDIALRSQIDPQVLAYVYAGKNIPLNERYISHLARKNSPYDVRGTSILSRVFKDLMYRDKLREAQFCHIEGTEVLTDRGFIDFRDLKLEDKVATMNINTGELEYQNPSHIHTPKFNGYMYHFKNRQVDICVTPNHRMLVSGVTGNSLNGWRIVNAENVKKTYKFKASIDKWNGDNKSSVVFGGKKIKSNLLMKFLGFWISEGSISRSSRSYNIQVSQKIDNNFYKEFNECMDKIPYKFKSYVTKEGQKIWWLNDKQLYNDLENNFGKGAFGKKISKEFKNLSPKLLNSLLEYLIYGDGHIRERKDNKIYKVYSTVSQQLANDVQEISFKCGFSPTLSTWVSKEGTTIYSIHWSDKKIEYFGLNDDKRWESTKNNISKEYYNGTTYCVTVPNGIFITRYNGKISIQGNCIADNHITPLKIFKVGTADGTYRPTSDDLTAFRQMLEEATYDPNFTLVTHPGLEVQYVGSTGVILPLDGEMDRIEDRVLTGLFTSKAFTHSEGPTYANASVALEVLQQRYVSFRTLIEKWLEIKIFRPICKIQGFERISGGRKELILPRVNWDKINLKNNREYQQTLFEGVKDNKISIRTWFRALDLSFDEEMKNINEEMDEIKKINYKAEQPYTGPENINVSELGKEGKSEPEQEIPESGGGEDFGAGVGGSMPDLDGGGEGGGDNMGLDALPGSESGGAEGGGVSTPQ